MVALTAAAASAVTGLVAITLKTANTADSLLKMSDETGIAVEQLSLLRFTAEQSDTSLESLSKGMEGLSRAVVGSARGLKTYAILFEALGIETQDSTGKTRDMMEIMFDVADVFKDMENGATKAGLAVALGGNAFKDLIPFLNQGSEGIIRVNEEARRMGLQISTETAQAASILNDDLNKLKRTSTALAETWGAVLIPALNDLVKGILFLTSGPSLNDLADQYQRIHERLDEGRINITAYKIQMKALTDELSRQGFTIHDLLEVLHDEIRATEEQKESTDAATDSAKAANEERIRAINAILGKAELEKQAAEEAKRLAAIVKEGAAQEVKGLAIVQESLKLQLWKKGQIADFDKEYFATYVSLLKSQGKDAEEITIRLTKLWIRHTEDKTKITEKGTEEEQEIIATFQSWQEVAAQGVADSIKGIWSDQGRDFDDVWKGALNQFVDTLAQMVIQNAVAMTAIQVAQAAATAGMSLFVGLLGSVLGGRGSSGPSEVDIALENAERALERFAEGVRDTIESFEFDIASPSAQQLILRERIEGGIGNIEEAFEILSEWQARVDELNVGGVTATLGPQPFVDFKESILENSEIIEEAIKNRYDLEVSFINNIIGLIGSQDDFVKDLDANIQNISRALLSPDELFKATQGDIAALKASIPGLSDEEQVKALADLQGLYNDLFSQAQSLFEEDPAQLERWQDFVIDGLEGVKESGIEAYDELIDIALEQLDLTDSQLTALLESNDLIADLNAFVEEMGEAVLESLSLLDEIATATPEAIEELAVKLGEALGPLGIDIPTAHTGALTTRAGLVAVQAAELITPAGGGTGAGGPINITLLFPGAFPNITSFDEFNVGEAELVIKNVFFQAVENLARSGHTWPMKVSSDA